MLLRDSVGAPRDAPSLVRQATVTGVAVDGTVSVDFGDGQTLDSADAIEWYAPVVGHTVEVLRRDLGTHLVLGRRRAVNTLGPSAGQVTLRVPNGGVLSSGQLHGLFAAGTVGGATDYALVEVRNSSASSLTGATAWLGLDLGGAAVAVAVATGAQPVGTAVPGIDEPSLTYSTPTSQGAGLALPTLAAGERMILALRRVLAGAVAKSPESNTLNVAGPTVAASASFPFNVLPAVPGGANPLVVTANAIRSWRNNEGWSGASESNNAAQGAYNTRWGYYRGCYFYGATAFDALEGRTCTGLTIRLHRTGSGGIAGAERVWLAPHVHAAVPSGGAPLFAGAANNVGTLAWNDTATFTLPTWWGQGLINGTIKGIAHLYLGTSDYAIFHGLGTDSLSGRLSLSWA